MKKLCFALVFATTLVPAPTTVADETAVVDETLSFPKIAKIKKSSADPYGDAAKRRGFEGRVAVTYELAADGRATMISIASYDEPQLAYVARDFFKLIEFEPPKDPPAPSGEARRHVLGLIFCLQPSGVPADFPADAKVTAKNLIVLAGSRLPTAPVRTAPGEDTPAECKKPRR
jgi:hypothetical protein